MYRRISYSLPAENPRASGLRLTDLELRALYEWCGDNAHVNRAYIYGSRFTGVRLNPNLQRYPDINLACQITVSDDEDAEATRYEILRHVQSASLPYFNFSLQERVAPATVDIRFPDFEPDIAAWLRDGCCLLYPHLRGTPPTD